MGNTTKYKPGDTSWTRPATDAVSVSASATAISGGPTRGLYLGASGDVTVTFVDGTSLTLVGLAAGVIHPISVTHVTALANGAANCIALF